MSNKVLIPEDVMAIYARCLEGESQTSIAKDFAISQATVSGIKRGYHWSALTGADRNRPVTPRQRRLVQIYKACQEENLPVKEIAAQHGVSLSFVYQVRSGVAGAQITGHANPKARP